MEKTGDVDHPISGSSFCSVRLVCFAVVRWYVASRTMLTRSRFSLFPLFFVLPPHCGSHTLVALRGTSEKRSGVSIRSIRPWRRLLGQPHLRETFVFVCSFRRAKNGGQRGAQLSPSSHRVVLCRRNSNGKSMARWERIKIQNPRENEILLLSALFSRRKNKQNKKGIHGTNRSSLSSGRSPDAERKEEGCCHCNVCANNDPWEGLL